MLNLLNSNNSKKLADLLEEELNEISKNESINHNEKDEEEIIESISACNSQDTDIQKNEEVLNNSGRQRSSSNCSNSSVESIDTSSNNSFKRRSQSANSSSNNSSSRVVTRKI